MRVLAFGTYDRHAARNRLLIGGLRANGVRVDEVHEPLWRGTAEKVRLAGGWAGRLGAGWRLLRAWARLLWRARRARGYDAVLVGYPGHLDVLPARLVAWRLGCPLLLDLFVTLTETVVEDRALARPGSATARLVALIDRVAVHCADRVLADTAAHAAAFAALGGRRPVRTAVVPVGAEAVFAEAGPAPAGPATTVLYFGGYIPLHGVETILGAAERLAHRPDIRWVLVGDGQTYPAMRQLAEARQLRHVRFERDWLPEAELVRRHIGPAAICLGIFGAGAKAARVVPNKVYAALAAGRVTITADTPAAREVLTDGADARLTPPGDAAALANAVAELADDPAARRAMAERGQALWHCRYRPEAIGLALKQVIEEMIG